MTLDDLIKQLLEIRESKKGDIPVLYNADPDNKDSELIKLHGVYVFVEHNPRRYSVVLHK